MLINDLPNDCLLAIFGHLHFLEDLIEASKVCVRWNDLITLRLKGVKYLLSNAVESEHLGDPELVEKVFDELRIKIGINVDYVGFVSDREDLISKDDLNTLIRRESKEIGEIKLDQLLPNLRIFDCGHLEDDKIAEITINNPTIKGIIYHDSGFPPNIDNMEMIAIKSSNIDCSDDKFHSDKLTQFYLDGCRSLWLIHHLKIFTSLCRLHIEETPFGTEFHNFFEIPINQGLKILEMPLNDYDFAGYIFPTSLFLDYFPSLESVFLFNRSRKPFSISTIKNLNMRDLVIEERFENKNFNQKWESLRSMLMKFPNLQNLAIRNSDIINDDHVKELVKLLPEVKLLDFRGSYEVSKTSDDCAQKFCNESGRTVVFNNNMKELLDLLPELNMDSGKSMRVTKKSADYLEKYCKESGRSIVIYYDCDDEPEDWPKLSESKDLICSGFDFMKNCFFRGFNQLPYFLD